MNFAVTGTDTVINRCRKTAGAALIDVVDTPYVVAARSSHFVYVSECFVSRSCLYAQE